jgi:hypothetical protein
MLPVTFGGFAGRSGRFPAVSFPLGIPQPERAVGAWTPTAWL